MKKLPRIIYAGDRDISVSVLKFMARHGVLPLALLVSGPDRATHAGKLVDLCPHLSPGSILKGDVFRTDRGIKLISSLKPDYIINVHFPYIFPGAILKTPKCGVLNLHPAYLPFNRGWHTPIWAILDGTAYGATLHFMDEGLDTGDIVCQEQIKVYPFDTADSLYRRVKKLEFAIFKKAWPVLLSGAYVPMPQPEAKMTAHKKKDIMRIQPIDFDQRVKAGDLIKKLRALTTNDIKEAAYFTSGGKKYYMQLKIREEGK
jgi:methionyl-tRNA formyltransferase